MTTPVLIMAITAGICLQAALSNGVAGLSSRPRDPVRVTFALLAAAGAAGCLSVIAMYLATTPEQYTSAMRWGLFPAGAAWTLAAIWFVAFFTGIRPTRVLLALSAGLCAFVVVDMTLPTGLLADTVVSVTTSSLAGSKVSSLVMPPPHPLSVAADAMTLAAFAFMLYAAWRAHRSGARRGAAAVGAAVIVLLVVEVFDMLHAYGVVWDVYLTQLAFAAVVVAGSVALRRQSSRTETELAAYRGRLESMVEERMHELEEAHERLAEESRRRLATAAALRRRVADLDGLQQISRILADRADLATALREVEPGIAAFLEADDARVVLTSSAAQAVGGAPVRPAEPRLVTADGSLDVPVAVRGHSLGALHVTRSGGEPFSQHERGLAQTVADDIAAAVENEVLHARQTRAAAEEERQRLARELHDAVAQTVYSAALIAEALPAVWDRDEQEGRENVSRLRRLTRAALAETRALLFELRPAALEAAPLDALLERLGDAVAGQFPGEVTVTATECPDLPSDVKLAFYRVAQEAFANVVKHAQATDVRLDLRRWPDGTVVLEVRDDGRGFDLSGLNASTMGIRMMHERMENLGATLALDSRAGSGTTITATWPGGVAGRAAGETM